MIEDGADARVASFLNIPVFGGNGSAVDIPNNRENWPNPSHISLHVASSGSTTPIPSPATAWILLAGLGGCDAASQHMRRAA